MAFFVKNALRSVGGAVYLRLYTEERWSKSQVQYTHCSYQRTLRHPSELTLLNMQIIYEASQ